MSEHTCSAPRCPNKSSVNGQNSTITFHQFPKPGSKLHSEWEAFCEYLLPAENPELCSNHFTKNFFIAYVDNSGKLIRKLHPKAKPTIQTIRSDNENDPTFTDFLIDEIKYPQLNKSKF